MKKAVNCFLSVLLVITSAITVSGQNLDWVNRFGGGPASNDEGRSLVTDPDGNLLVTGYFNSTVDFDPSFSDAIFTAAGFADVFLAKYDTTGSLLWAKSMGGTGNEYPNSIALDGDGNIFITGTFYGTADFDPSAATLNLVAAGNSDVFLAKYDSAGNLLWAKAIGGLGYETGYRLTVSSNGVSGITGYFTGTADFDPSGSLASFTSSGYDDVFIATYDSLGNYLWAHAIGGADYDYGYGIASDNNGSYYITGSFEGTVDFEPSSGISTHTSSGADDIFIAKYDSSGNFLWSRSMGGTGIDIGYSLGLDAAENIYLLGNFQGVADFNPPNSANLSSMGGSDIFLVKYSSSGTYSWSNKMGGTNHDHGYYLKVDASGFPVITGNFMNTVDFDPSSGTASLISGGASDIYLARYDTAGSYQGAIGVTGSGWDYGYSIADDIAGNLYITGYFELSADFDPSSDNYNLTSAGGRDIYIARYSPADINDIAESYYPQSIKVYPNPAHSVISISSDSPMTGVLKLTDLQGRNRLYKNISERKLTDIDISFVPRGIYFLHILTDDGIFIEKIVVE